MQDKALMIKILGLKNLFFAYRSYLITIRAPEVSSPTKHTYLVTTGRG
jgi:hypothetical protein